MNNELLWQKFLEKVHNKVNSMVYAAWFANSSLLSFENNKATIMVPSEIHKSRLETVYKDVILSTFLEINGTQCDLEFVLEDSLDILDKKENTKKTEESSKPKPSFRHESNLKPQCTFETFVVGDSNRFAHAAAFAVAESPGLTYNPLFIYGNSGLGKTHLMHAIGNYIEATSDKKVLYVTSEQFISDFSGIGRKENEVDKNYSYADYFKDKYRNIDVLIIDDIQFLAGATQTQQEFFHTFNTLYDNKKQIIISSDRSPNDLKLLEDRLRTRFSWGLTANIYPPDFDLRLNILKKKINGEKISKTFPEDVLEYIASNISSDVRKLEGAINRLLIYSTMMGGADITLSLAVDALKDDVSKGTSEKHDISKIQRVVADFFQISVDDLKGKKRSASIAFPRQIAMFLSRDVLNESYQRIGLEFGGKDHTTVIHSCEKIQDDIKRDKSIRETVEKIKQQLL